MGLFGRDDRPQNSGAQAQPKPNPEPKPTPKHPASSAAQTGGSDLTTVARSCRLEGKLKSSSDVTIDGQISGSVDTSGHLHVTQSGMVDATLHGRLVSIAGQVKGDVTANERIELEPSADVKGNITAPRILIKDGATFEGQVYMKSPQKGGPGNPPKNDQGKPQGNDHKSNKKNK